MNTAEIERLVYDAIGDSWDVANHHGVDLRKSLVPPRLIKVIQRLVHAGKIVKSVPYRGRTPHVHFAVKNGRDKFTTQCYIKGHPASTSFFSALRRN
jgi:hypothetical protein